VTTREKASDFPKEVLALFDGYVHGHIQRRDFLEGAGVGGAALGLGLESSLKIGQGSGSAHRCS